MTSKPLEDFDLDFVDDDLDIVQKKDQGTTSVGTPLRANNKVLTNLVSPKTPIHKKSDSISSLPFIMNLSPLRDIKEDKFYEVEQQLQNWIEKSLSLNFVRKDSGHDRSPHSFDMPSKKDSSRTFYYNLENGQVLCRLLHMYFPNYINMEKVHIFDQQIFTFNTDKTLNSTYLFHSKNNINLFLSGLRKIDGFPVDLLFTFEDVFLQKNKKLILCSLTQLHEKALFYKQQEKDLNLQYQEEQKFMEQLEEDLRSIQEEDQNGKSLISPRDNPEIAIAVMDKIKRQSVMIDEPLRVESGVLQTRKVPSPLVVQSKPLPPLPKTPTTPGTESSLSQLLKQIDDSQQEGTNTDSAMKSIISVFTLPFVILLVIVLKIYTRLYKEKTN